MPQKVGAPVLLEFRLQAVFWNIIKTG
jgi:hypothetical protein